MIGRIVSLQGSPPAITQAEQAILGQGLGILKGMPGLEGLHVFARPAEGRAAVITLWSDEAAAAAAFKAMSPVQQRAIDLKLVFTLQDFDVKA